MIITQRFTSETVRILSSFTDDGSAIGKGTTTIGGQRWVQYSDDDGKSIWVADLTTSRIALFSKADDSELRTLGTAVVASAPLQPRANLPIPTG